MVNYFIPKDLKEALNILDKESLIPYCGGTDLMIDFSEDKKYIFLHNINEIKNITKDEKNIYIGSACTFTEIYNNSLCPIILKEIISQIAAPAIRNIGTIGGNIANGSPKADSVLFLYATNSSISIESKNKKRIISIIDFYKGRKVIDLKNNEIITKIIIPRSSLLNINYYYEKVGARKALAISRVSFLGIISIENKIITKFSVSFGAVSDTIIKNQNIEKIMIGKTIEEAKIIKKSFISKISNSINPISGRVSKEYRKDVCLNLLKEFLNKNGI